MVSRGRALRRLYVLVRLGVLEMIVYRAEVLLWILSTTMPLIMMALFAAVTHEAPLGELDEPRVVAYFLMTFIVRNLTGSWISWQISQEVRDGTLSMRLLRPVPTWLAYAAESVGNMPFRVLIAVAVSAVFLWVSGPRELTHDPLLALLVPLALLLSATLTLLVSLFVGSLAFFFESSHKIMDVWLAAQFVFSGYLIPLELFPEGLQRTNDWLPFRYQIGLPVELALGAHSRVEALTLLARQVLFVMLAALVLRSSWRRGVARFEAYGG